ncbi:Juxtaposed with another zinc finger protein 1 [Oryzias melastigma]|uniref:Juxtaposed with another zinc finger protein 1 n=1 Tax=Oryzias melastigma TaxID=30732 RepID=A0A834F0M2_ORYME|nr:Juxtaposed with another zinc finger protein 1 [Oryzias melastigma]
MLLRTASPSQPATSHPFLPPHPPSRLPPSCVCRCLPVSPPRCLLRALPRSAPAPDPKPVPPRSPTPAPGPPSPPSAPSECTGTMTGIAAASFFSNSCRFGGCGLQFESLAELIVHIEDNHIDTDPRVLEKQEQQQPTYLALSYINRFMTDAARREQETMKKKATPKLSLSITGGMSRNSTATPPRHTSGNLTPPVTPPITPSSSFRSSTPTGSEYDEEEVDYEESDSDESWTTESAISSESILSSMCMNGGEEKPFACPVPGCKKRYKNVNGIKYHCQERPPHPDPREETLQVSLWQKLQDVPGPEAPHHQLPPARLHRDAAQNSRLGPAISNYPKRSPVPTVPTPNTLKDQVHALSCSQFFLISSPFLLHIFFYHSYYLERKVSL